MTPNIQVVTMTTRTIVTSKYDDLGEVAIATFRCTCTDSDGVHGVWLESADLSRRVGSHLHFLPAVHVRDDGRVVVDAVAGDARVGRRVPGRLEGRRRHATQLDVCWSWQDVCR